MSLIVKTDQPLMHNRAKITSIIAKFWDQLSEGWHEIWGPHIHHGYYESDHAITPKEAQELLIEKLVEKLQITESAKILDAGCGMGGSSRYLAQKYQATVWGVTLSERQVAIATQQALNANLKNVHFIREDALTLNSFEDNSFDIVWSLESCEQFYDKDLFLQQAFRVLKPGGKLLLATWCSSQPIYEGNLAKKYHKLCFAFDLPYLPTIEHYQTLIKQRNFSLQLTEDWSQQVERSWDIGISLANAYSFLQVLKKAGWRGFRFTQQLRLMQEGFREGRVKYGVFLAVKPSSLHENGIEKQKN